MKDKEKAKEILEKVSFNKYLGESYIPSDDSENCEFNCGFVKNMIVQSAIEMAEWKDEQFSKFLLWLDDNYVIRRFTDGESLGYAELIDNFKSMKQQ